MSHRRKHVSQALLQDASPEVLAGQRILRVCEHRGSNMLEVEDDHAQRMLVRMPNRFNKLLWVKTGSYLIADVADAPGGDKVRGEVTAVLYEAHVRQMRKDGRWPPGFAVAPPAEESYPAREEEAPGQAGSGDDSDSDGGLPPLEANMNRAGGTFHSAGHGGDHALEEEEDGSDDGDSSREDGE